MDRADVVRVLEQIPNLTAFGVGVYHLTPASERRRALLAGREELLAAEDEWSKALAWLVTVYRTKSVNRRQTSYTYKHDVESALGGCVRNGAFIAAAIHAGFEYRIKDGGPNVWFNISERSRRTSGKRSCAPHGVHSL